MKINSGTFSARCGNSQASVAVYTFNLLNTCAFRFAGIIAYISISGRKFLSAPNSLPFYLWLANMREFRFALPVGLPKQTYA
jgi:hypothetical protein